MMLLVAIVMGAKAETESPGQTGSKDTDYSGTSFSIAGTYIAGEGGASVSGMANRGMKIRTNKESNTLLLTVNSGYQITGLHIDGIANDNSKTTTVTRVDVDGAEVEGFSTVTFPNKNASTCGVLNVTGFVAKTSIKLYFGSDATQANLVFTITYSAVPQGPTITTQPQSASYVTGDPISALTVEATPNTATYQWYSCDDANRTNAQPIENATSASYTPTGAGFYYVAVTAGTTVNSDVAQITVSEASAPTSATIESTSSSAEIGADVTLSITAMDGTPTPTEFKWYSCADADKTDATEIEGETGNSYTFSKNSVGTYYFFANVKNSQGNVDSNVLSVTITKKAAGLAYATTAVQKNINDANFTNTLTNPNGLTVTYSVVEGATATGVEVNETTGEVIVGSVGGTATIKASFAGDDEYNAGEASYTLTVNVPDPTVTVTPVTVSSTATAGNIAFTIGYPVVGGVVTAAEVEEAEWLTLGAVGDGTVAFTTEVNNGFASRYAKVNVTYTYNTNQTVTKPVMVSQEPNMVGTSIIKVSVTANNAGTVTGSIGGTATVALQNSAVDGGYKFGGNGNNITLTLADSKTFQTGDVIIIHTTQAGELSNGYITIYDGNNTSSSNTVLYTETQGGIGINGFVLPSEANGKTTISVMRKNNSGDYLYNWNGYVDYVEVVRPNTTIELNDGGSSFTKGFSTFCASANYTLTGATAYAATISDSKLIMTAIEGVIPANEGVVIAGDKSAEVTINYTTEAATTVTDNDLKGTTVAAKTADLKGTAAKFLAFKKTTSTFTPYGGENFPANKAYILLDGENAPLSLDMVFDEATGINNVNAAETEAQASPVKVIKNGKLYIGNYNVAGQQVK